MNKVNSTQYNTPISDIYSKWLRYYQKTNKPQSANFWNIFEQYRNRDRYTHLIHAYPSKLLSHIPAFFLEHFLPKKGTVLDPFCGSGTVLLEGFIKGHSCIGIEINPIARLISKVKTTPIPPDKLRVALKNSLKRAQLIKPDGKFTGPNADYWFVPRVKSQLTILRNAINTLDLNNFDTLGPDIKNFLWVCFSALIRRKSLADPRVSPPVRLNPEKFKLNPQRRSAIEKLLIEKKRQNTFSVFKEIAEINISRMNRFFADERVFGNSEVIWDDARNIRCGRLLDRGILEKEKAKRLRASSVDLIITSPPYINAQKYTRSLSLEMFLCGHWQNRSARAMYDRQVIGTERVPIIKTEALKSTGIRRLDNEIKRIAKISAKRAGIVLKYFEDIQQSLIEMHRVLKKDRYLVLVIGNNKIFGKEIRTDKIIKEIAINDIGFELELVLYDDIKSWGLMTKRNTTADIISREWILVLKKA